MTLAQQHPLAFVGSPKHPELTSTLTLALFLLKNGWQRRVADRLWRHPRKPVWMSIEAAVEVEGKRAERRKARAEKKREGGQA